MTPLARWLFIAVFPNGGRRSLASTAGRGALLVAIAVFSLYYFRVPLRDLGQDPGWMHHVHLVFHEAGHAIAAMITDHRVVVVFMGSALQVLFPLVVAGAFYWTNHDGLGSALGLWWAGHALLDVAPYIADARALQLPLLTGGTGREVEGHDWEYLLATWHALPLDLAIAGRVALIARMAMALALLWGAATIVYDRWCLTDDAARR